MADSNRVTLSFKEESTFGTDPTGTYAPLRITSESLKADLSLASSEEIRSYRDIPGLILTDKAVSGSIDGNLSYGSWDDFFQYGIMSADFSAELACETAGGTIAADASADTLTLSTGTWNNQPVVGQYIAIKGSSSNDGMYRVTTVSTTVIGVGTVKGLATETLAIGEVFVVPQILNGTTLNTATMQRNYSDLSTTAAKFKGMAVNGFSVEATGQDPVKCSFDMVGLVETSETSINSISAFGTTKEMTSTDHVQRVLENGAAVASTGFSFQVENNLRTKYQLGTLGATSFNPGDLVITGTLQAYFDTATLYNKFINQTETSLDLELNDETSDVGNSMVFSFPTVKFTDAQRVAGGRNEDIIADISWQATYNSTQACSIRISKTATG